MTTKFYFMRNAKIVNDEYLCDSFKHGPSAPKSIHRYAQMMKRQMLMLGERENYGNDMCVKPLFRIRSKTNVFPRKKYSTFTIHQFGSKHHVVGTYVISHDIACELLWEGYVLETRSGYFFTSSDIDVFEFILLCA